MTLRVCQWLRCLRFARGDVIGLISQGNIYDGRYCRRHGPQRVAANLDAGRFGRWGLLHRHEGLQMTWARVQAQGLSRELLKERDRQITDEGYTDAHDDEEHGSGGLVALAGQYATDYLARGDRRRLVQAGALVLAALAAHDRRADDMGGQR